MALAGSRVQSAVPALSLDAAPVALHNFERAAIASASHITYDPKVDFPPNTSPSPTCHEVFLIKASVRPIPFTVHTKPVP